MVSVPRVTAAILVLAYLALGSGAVERWHNAQHAAEDARVLAAARESGAPLPQTPFHNDVNCVTHAQIHLSGLAVAWVPLLILLGLFVAFLSQLPVQLPAADRLFVLACRGPPAR